MPTPSPTPSGCSSSPCSNGATCANTDHGGFVCSCSPNYYGVQCTSSHNDCPSALNTSAVSALCGNGTCINTARNVQGAAAYTCVCELGWSKPTGVEECTVPPPTPAPTSTPVDFECTKFSALFFLCARIKSDAALVARASLTTRVVHHTNLDRDTNGCSFSCAHRHTGSANRTRNWHVPACLDPRINPYPPRFAMSCNNVNWRC